MSQWTFGRKIAAGFAAIVCLTMIIGVVAALALRAAVSSKDDVINLDAEALIEANALLAARQGKSAATREYFLTPTEAALRRLADERAAIARAIAALRRLAYSEDTPAVDRIEALERSHQTALEPILALRRTDASLEAVVRAFDGITPIRTELDAAIATFIANRRARLDAARQRSSDAAWIAQASVVTIALLVAVGGVLTAWLLSRSLTRQIGRAVSQVQSSSAELQAAATQQAASSKQQATAMNEISTTISELLATSRQIAAGAQRVALVASQTAGSARTGEGVVGSAHESIASIRRQVDLIVGHMLELGRKSQQIGSVLDIVAELAEQTNILAINATIEAAGAGEAGRRFGVVAEEIRKLADRVAGSAKEIRGLIEDVRGAVNTTVMVTETGSKAVDAGTRQFEQVATAFTQIVTLVGSTTEAGREIELSTKQQTTAVEQVNSAISEVAQASRETEANSGQTQQTAAQLAGLSRDLLRLVQPQGI